MKSVEVWHEVNRTSLAVIEQGFFAVISLHSDIPSENFWEKTPHRRPFVAGQPSDSAQGDPFTLPQRCGDGIAQCSDHDGGTLTAGCCCNWKGTR